MNKHDEYEDGLRRLFEGRGYRPMRSRDMAYLLGVPKKEFRDFRGVLEELRGEGAIIRGRDARWRLPGAEEKFLVGAVDIALAGHAFVIPDDPGEPDVFVPPDRLLDAFDGDKVKVRVVERERRGEKRLSGEVTEVIGRARTRIVGVMLPSGRAAIEDPRNNYEFDIVFSPEAPEKSASQAAKSMRMRRNDEKAGLEPKKISVRRTVAANAKPPSAGMKVLLGITSWPRDPGGPKAMIVEVLGPAGDPDAETAAILAENDAPGPFGAEALQEARRLKRELTPEETACRLDLRDEICCTIDPEDARDFDDALGVRVNPDGTLTVDVHIADVSRCVVPGGALDRESRERSTSIYLPERVIPMLPEEISNDVCSLRPGEDRPAKTIRIVFSPDGKRLKSTIHRSLIRSRRRFAYGEVRELVESAARREEFEDKELLACVLELHRLAMELRRRRLDGGAVELNLAEYRVALDAEGRAEALEHVEHDSSHQLVEEFMLAANLSAAEWAARNGLPALHRLHHPPKEERLEELSEYLNASGYAFKPPFQRRKLMAVVKKAAGRPEEHAINLMILKSFQQAVYGPDPDVGHFALNFPKYMHFTSPIRRYPDLHLHQMLDKAFEAGTKKADKLPQRLRRLVKPDDDMESLGLHCSSRERRAMRIEGEVKEFHRLALLSRAVDKEFPAVVTGVKKFGVFVEISDYFVEGMIPKAALAQKGYSTREELPPQVTGKMKKRLQMAGDPGFHIGQLVRVRVRRVDLSARRCELDFLGI